MIRGPPVMPGAPPKGAWAKNVWGVDATKARELKEGESGCCICFNAPEEIRFSPCKHAVCQPCLDQLRKANIFKADAGIKCPFCRQFVEEYFPIAEGGSKANAALVEANRAARAAAAARLPVKKQAALQDVQAPAAHQEWECTKCNNINYSTRSKCNKCGQPGPKGAPPVNYNPTGPRKDILKCTDKEIRDSALEKLHPNLNQALQEAGTPAQSGLAPGTVGGNADSVIAAMPKHGQERLHHIIRSLSEHGHLKELTTAFYGNYTVQDLLDAAHKLRQAAAKLRARKTASSQDIERMLGFSDGQDSLGRLVTGIVGAMPEGATHKQGFYVVAKVLEVAEPADILPLAIKLFPGSTQLTADLHTPEAWRGVKVMVSLVEAMSELAFQGGHRSAAAMGLLNSLCGLYLKDQQALQKLAMHRNYGQMLVDAAFAGLPRPQSKQMLTYLATNARQFVENRWGWNTVSALVSLTAANEECQDVVVTHICIAAQALEGSFVKTAIKVWNAPAPASGADLVWKILQRLDDESEHSWVKSIVNELFKGFGTIQKSPKALDMLVDALCLKGIPDQAAASHAQMLTNFLGDAKAEPMLKKVEMQRGAKITHPADLAYDGAEQPGDGSPHVHENGGDYSSVFASPPRNVPATTAPAAPHPSMLRPPVAPPPVPPRPPAPAPPPAPPISNGVPASGPLLPIPPPTQMANGVRPPPLQRLMVSPRGQGYKPGPPPGMQPPASSAAVPPPLAHLIPHLMVGMPGPAAAPPASQPAPTSRTSVPQGSGPSGAADVNGHPREQQSGPAPAAPRVRMPVITPPAAPPEQHNIRPAQNGIHPPAPARQPVQPPAVHAARNAVRPSAARPAAPPAANHGHPATLSKTWSCLVCTYKHDGAEAEFLACAICGTPMPPDT